MSHFSESSDECTIQSDEEQSDEEFVTHTRVVGYLYETKKKKCDGIEPKVFIDTTDLETRIDSFSHTHLLYSKSL